MPSIPRFPQQQEIRLSSCSSVALVGIPMIGPRLQKRHSKFLTGPLLMSMLLYALFRNQAALTQSSQVAFKLFLVLHLTPLFLITDAPTTYVTYVPSHNCFCIFPLSVGWGEC